MRFGKTSAFNAVLVSASVVITLLGQPVFAQNGALPDGISMVTLNTQNSAAGQTVITPKGYVVPVPGAGVNTPVLQVFMGSKGGYWYVDKNGQQVDLTPTVQRLQGSVMQSQPKAAAPKYAPAPMMYSATPAYAQPAATNNMATTAVVGATAAGLGAMTGAAMANSSNNNNYAHMPYGTPVHYGENGTKAVYDPNNKTVYAANSQTGKAGAYHPENTAYHSDNMMQQQQNWYKEQQAKQTEAYKNWQKPTSNPFVANGSEMNKFRAEGGTASRARFEGRARMGGFRR